MSNYRNDDWRDAKRDLNRGFRFGWGWIVISVLIVLALGAIIWGINVATSQVRGVGNAVIRKNSAENWTAAQARFEDMYSDIVATDAKIAGFKTILDANPTDPTAQTNYTGTTNYCLSAVGDYNAEARKFLSEDFRSADLPDQINPNDPSTDCK